MNGRVDPGLLRQSRWLRRPSHESLRVSAVGGKKRFLARSKDLFGFAVMDDRRHQQSDSRVMMLVVVVVKKLAAEFSGILNASESIRKLRAVLHRLELRFRVRVVIGNMRSRVALDHAQVTEQQSNGLASHRCSTICVNRQLVTCDFLLPAGFGNQALGQGSTFSMGDHPAHDVAAEDVQDHVQVEVGPLDRAANLRDVPTPNLIGRLGQQLGFLVFRMAQLVPAFLDFAVFRQNSVHGTNRAEVGVLVQKRGPDLGWRPVDEYRRTKYVEDLLTICRKK